MKKRLFPLIVLISVVSAQAQTVFKSLTLNTAGTLNTALTLAEKNTVTKLQLSGSIDARDIKILKSSMPKLDTVDLSQTTIMAYQGSAGPVEPAASTSYPANTLPQQSFVQNSVLKSVVLPSGLTAIGEYAFYMGYSILRIHIPAKVTSIGGYTFYACGAYLNVDPANSTFTSEEGVLYNKNKTVLYAYTFYKTGGHTIPNTVTMIKGGAFAYCDNLQSVVIPESVNTIEAYAFDVCKGLKTLTIPASVITIGSYAFAHCSGLRTVYSPNETPAAIQASTFAAVDADSCLLFVPGASISAYEGATGWNVFTKVNGYNVGLNDESWASVRVFPNPVVDEIFIEGVNEALSVEIFDMRGLLVVSKEMYSSGKLSLTTLPKGTYIVKLTNAVNRTSIRKIVKQ